jgi:hypothetical protein
MEKILNNWWPMPLFLHTYFKGVGTVLHNMEVEKVKIETYDISVGVCLWFCRLDVVLKLGSLELYYYDCIRV